MPAVRRADVAQELFDLWHAIRRATLEKFNEDGLSFSRAKVLWNLEDGSLRASAIADCIHVSGATVTELVDALAKDGLVTRTPDPNDRRAVLIDLTPAGREVAKVSRAHKRRILDQIFDCLTADEADQLKGLLDKLAASENLQHLQGASK